MAALRDRDGRVIVTNDRDAPVLQASESGIVLAGPIFDVESEGAHPSQTASKNVDAWNTTIQKAIAAGGVVLGRAGVYPVNDTIYVPDSVRFMGSHASGYFFGGTNYISGTVLKYVGAAGATVMKISPTSLSRPVIAPTFENLQIDGNGLAAVCLRVEATVQGVFKQIAARAATTAALQTGITSLGGYSGLNFTYGCQFSNVWLDQNSASFGDGIQLTGHPTNSAGGDTTFCEFRNVMIHHLDGVGFKVVGADHNLIQNIGCSRAGGGTGIGIELMGNSAGGYCANYNVFELAWPGTGGVTARNGVQPSVYNQFFGYSTADSAPEPVVESGANLSVVYLQGNKRMFGNGRIEQSGSGTPEGVVTAPPGSIYHRTDGGAGTSFYVKESGTGNTGWIGK